ncbi:rust resistance kinase Lr10-like [Cryptomeria japonica]|uniref:rust resistance kinase Lr10-like n=1 Tax=Cryptomeria japonica TaxID=3369 RepID=UPI0027DA5485|nr:rust resistance kinase Lr10-like [Cryptomeria japonica]
MRVGTLVTRMSRTLRSVCQSSVTVGVTNLGSGIQDGFQVKSEPNKICTNCMSEGWLCVYNETDSTQIYCKWPKNKPPGETIILGGVIGTVALLLMGALLLFLNRRRCLPTSQNPDLSNVEKFLQDYVHQMPCRYSYSQLMKITNKFAYKVGEGGFGVVYKGKLPTGGLVAVKMLDQSRRCENQFMNEVPTIGRIHHVHLVRLMEYFYEEHRNALVYEYMANGSLDEFIFAGREKEAILNWAQLYSIALGAARGIAYLHQDCDNRIIHFDIKPHNILLD